MMRLRLSTLALCAGLLVAGCSSPDNREAKNTPQPANPPSTAVPTAASKGAVPGPTPSAPSENKKPATPGDKKPAAPPATPSGAVAKNTTPAKPSTPPSEWRPAAVKPQQVAQQVDSMLSSLSGVSAEVTYRMILESGDLSGDLHQKIKSPTVYSLQYPVIYQLTPETSYTHADGKVVRELVKDKQQVRPVTTKRQPPQDIVENYSELAPREVFAGLLDHRKPFTEYVSALLKPTSGYQVSIGERSGQQNGHPVRQYRIHAVRKGPAAAKLGESEVVIIVDANVHLPVVVSAQFKKPGASRLHRLDWTAKWQNHQKFDPSEFAVVKQTVTHM